MTTQRTTVFHCILRSVATLLLAVVVSAAAYGQTPYTWVPTGVGSNNGNWTGGTRWDQPGYPNGEDVAAVINLPAGDPAAGYFITLGVPDPGLTIGHLTINNPDPLVVPEYVNTTTIRPGGSAPDVPLKFKVSSGAATYTETSLGQLAGRTVIASNVPIELLSDLIVTQNHKNSSAENGGTDFSGPIIGTSGRTFTKEGSENILLRSSTQSYEGKYVINNGAIRIPNNGAMGLSTGVTVNPGGQLQLGQTEIDELDWNFATGATLTLKGNGKAAGINDDGALRFQLAADGGSTSNFNNLVILAENAAITVSPGTGTNGDNIGVLTNVVSGPGGLIKRGPGILRLTNAANDYEGNSNILNGTLSITSTFLDDDADMLIGEFGTLHLDFPGVADDIRSLFIADEEKQTGLWGRVGSIAELGADFESNQIIGDGLLNVQVSAAVENGDFDGDGDVDGADFLTWQRHVSINDETADLADGDANDDGNVNGADLEIWKGQFGPASTTAAAPVPEPATVVLAGVAAMGFTLLRRKQRAA